MLFKILHGDKSRISTAITPYHEGYCYVTHDGYFYVDMNNERVKLNAKDAETLMGKSYDDIKDYIDTEVSNTRQVVMATINTSAEEYSASWLNNVVPQEDKLYVVKDDNMLYRWDGSSYVRVSVGITTKETYKFTATEETSTFVIPSDIYTPTTGTLTLIQDNVILIEGENYVVSGNYVTLVDYTLAEGESIHCIINTNGYGVDSLRDILGIDNKADKPIISAVTIYANKWSNNTYSFEDTYPFSTYNLEIELNGDSCTVEHMDSWSNARILGSATSNKIKAMGDVPTVDIPIIVKAVRK